MTLSNLLVGSIALRFQDPEWMAYFILLALLLDFGDGLLARLLNAQSEMGKQLDSLADMVSFGALPGLMMYYLLEQFIIKAGILDETGGDYWTYFSFIAFLIPLGVAWRLAKFNIDPQQQQHFRGLPCPAGALFFASLPLILHQDYNYFNILLSQQEWILMLFILLIVGAMVSDFQFFSLKPGQSSLRQKNILIFFLVLSLVLIFILKFLAVPLIIFLYFPFSLVYFKVSS